MKMDELTTVPLNAFFDSSGCQANPSCDPGRILPQADLILGKDVMTQRQVLLFGQKALEAITRSGVAKDMLTLCIELDLDERSDDLERALALVQVVKGHHDFPM